MSNDPRESNDPAVEGGHSTELPQATEDMLIQEGELLDAEPDLDADPADGENPDGSTLQQEIDALSDKLAVAESSAEENWNRFLGAQAEMQNMRKRAERDLQNERKFALEKFLKELLPVKDSLEMGIEEARSSDEVVKLLEGSELTLKMFTQVVEKFGVEEIEPLGKRFDPEHHEAMAMQPSDEAEPNTVLQVIRKGYSLNERVLRPAMVIVSRATEQDKT